MIGSEVGIYNLALAAVGARNNISLPTENSREAEVCRLWFSPVRDQLLASAVWPEATNFVHLAVLNTEDGDGVWAAGEARPGYTYAYALPTDCLRPQYLTNFDRFLISQRTLNSNTHQAILAYTMRLEIISLWSAELQMAIVYGLAAHICMPLSGKPSRARALLEQANNLVMNARVSAANASDERFDVLPDWIAARGFIDAQPVARFIYPYGSLLAATVNVN